MTIYVVDSSALVKRYVQETGSSWVLGLFDPTFNHEIFIAAITAVEIVAAITRRSRGGGMLTTDAEKICHQFKYDLQKDYLIVEITETIINSGMSLSQKYGLRGYDAVQLAVGCAINSIAVKNKLPAITFVSADDELNKAVVQEGLMIENPNYYP